MKEKITPCFWFNGQAKEAATLYCSVFETAKITAQSPIVTAINVSGQNFTLLDGGPMYKPTPAISFYYICEKVEELDRIWNAFSKEGTVMMALDKYPWAEKYGWISDKFGISWQIIPPILPKMLGDKDPAKAGRAMQAMMKMKKIIIADLEKAYGQK